MRSFILNRLIIVAVLILFSCTANAQIHEISAPVVQKNENQNQSKPKPQSNTKVISYDTYNKGLLNKAEKGDAKAQYSLGMVYANGWGINKDEATALKWYKKAAEQDYSDAFYQLGVIYENGQIVQKDENQALEYYQKAADKGIEEAISRIEVVQNAMKVKGQQNEVHQTNEAENHVFNPKKLEDIPYILRNLINNMVVVEGGTLGLDSANGKNEDSEGYGQKQSVNVKTYSICKYEVTQEEWKIVMGNNPSRFKGNNLPVEQVSWNDCIEFIKGLNNLTGYNFRLPTETEWEYAAKGGNESNGFAFSGSNSVEDVAWFNPNTPPVEGGQITTQGLKTRNVGSKLPNELGLYDMSGNVFEWCQDSSGESRVIRGGCWAGLPKTCMVSSRNLVPSTERSSYIGIRLARSL